jgi:methylated-DNA-[protein]-cysteine S-methyltransferase
MSANPTSKKSLLARGQLTYDHFSTPVGSLWVAWESDRAVMSLLATDEASFVERCENELGEVPAREESLSGTMAAAISSRISDDAPLLFDLDGRTAFQRAVLDAVAAIPRGQVRTYGEIALAVGRPGAARAVGEVMRTNRLPVLIPCHRVVRAGGDVGNYTPEPSLKRALLVAEGAFVGSLSA